MGGRELCESGKEFMNSPSVRLFHYTRGEPFLQNERYHCGHKGKPITSTGRRGGRSGVRVYKAGRSPDETKPDEMKRSESERTKRKE